MKKWEWILLIVLVFVCSGCLGFTLMHMQFG